MAMLCQEERGRFTQQGEDTIVNQSHDYRSLTIICPNVASQTVAAER